MKKFINKDHSNPKAAAVILTITLIAYFIWGIISLGKIFDAYKKRQNKSSEVEFSEDLKSKLDNLAEDIRNDKGYCEE